MVLLMDITWICGLHHWDYRYDTGVSEYAPDERLYKFKHVISEGHVYVDEEEVSTFEAQEIPQRLMKRNIWGNIRIRTLNLPNPIIESFNHLQRVV